MARWCDRLSMVKSHEMTTQHELIADLQTLNEISLILNQSADMQSALNDSLAKLVDLMGLETGWIFMLDPVANERWHGRGFRLIAHHNLPPTMAATNEVAWNKTCDCQKLYLVGDLTKAYNEVRCSRLAGIAGDTKQLAIHASTPLRSGDHLLGILNVAAPSWSYFTPRNLSLLTNVGNQMGTALKRAQLFDAVQEQRIHEQAALLDVSQQLLSHRNLDELVRYIVETVRELISADACAVLLTGPDPDYLYFRAASGWIADPVGKGYRVPADDSTGSGWVMRNQQVMLLEDLEVYEPRRWSTDWLEREDFKAAAMIPLIANGVAIGALVIDFRTRRRFTETDVRFLRLMANSAALAIEKARLHQEELKRQRIEEELEVGRHIQMSMLPVKPLQLEGWGFAAYFEAARQVGGDFYDLFPLPGEPGRLGVVIADVSDKGVPAALFMALSRTTIRNIALRGRAPAEVLSWANRYIQEDSQSDMFLSAFYAELNTNTGQLTYANAGHNPPFLWSSAESRFIRLPPGSSLLGVLPDLNITVSTVEMAEGDVLVLYTDGITDAVNSDYQEFGAPRLEETMRKLLLEHPDVIADDLRTAIADEVRQFAGDMTQYDDITLLVIKRTHSNHGNQ